MAIRRLLRRQFTTGARAIVLAGLSLTLAGPAPAMTAAPADLRVEADPAAMAGRWEYTPEEAQVEAVRAALDTRLSWARDLATTARDPVVDTLIDWVGVLNSTGSEALPTIAQFVDAKGYWPRTDALLRRMESILYFARKPPEEVIAHFAAYPPIAATGRIALARAYEATGEHARARAQIVTVWRHARLDADIEKVVLESFSDTLTEEDQAARLSNRLYARDKAGALRQAKRLPEGEVAFARAVLALAGGADRGLKLHEALPEAAKARSVARYALTRYYRLKGDYPKAREIALATQTMGESAEGLDVWWDERRVLLRDALKRSNREAWQDAYELARAHGHSDGLSFVQGEFLAGWIALRFLHQPRRSLGHFLTLRAGDDVPLNVAQAEYWLGRAYSSLDLLHIARKHFRAAGRLSGTFYGQLARQRLGLDPVPASLACDRPVPQSVLDRVHRDELVHAALLIDRAGGGKHLRSFLLAAADRLQTSVERAAATMIAMEMTHPHVALRVAKASAHTPMDVRGLAYPVTELDYEVLTPPTEEALIYSVIRQESEFNPTAVSHAGARGLMQIMPNTAKSLSRIYKKRYSSSRLVSDPIYNVTLGAALLHELVAGFDGSYPMALAGYNAGPGRVREWLKDYGDPRRSEIALVDWIEAIPYNETRNYVKRVMENLHVYRARLGITQENTREASLGGTLHTATSCTAPGRQYAFN